MSDESKTMTAPRIKGHCREQDPTKSFVEGADALAEAEAAVKSLISAEMSLLSLNDGVKSNEWNNLKDLNDIPESSNTHRDSNAVKTSTQALSYKRQDADRVV